MELTLNFRKINPQIIANTKFTKLPKLNFKKTNNLEESEDSLKFSIKIEMLNQNTALLTTKINGITTLTNVERISNCVWEKVAILRENNIASIIYMDNSENNSPSLIREKTIETIHNGTNDPMTYAIFVLLSKNIESNSGIKNVQSTPEEYKFKKKMIVYGFDEKDIVLKHLEKLSQELSRNTKLAKKLKSALNPAYFILAKICGVNIKGTY